MKYNKTFVFKTVEFFKCRSKIVCKKIKFMLPTLFVKLKSYHLRQYLYTNYIITILNSSKIKKNQKKKRKQHNKIKRKYIRILKINHVILNLNKYLDEVIQFKQDLELIKRIVFFIQVLHKVINY